MMTADLLTTLLREVEMERQQLAESICICRRPDGTYCYQPVCWHQLLNGEGVPCQQVPDSGVRFIREEEIA